MISQLAFVKEHSNIYLVRTHTYTWCVCMCNYQNCPTWYVVCGMWYVVCRKKKFDQWWFFWKFSKKLRQNSKIIFVLNFKEFGEISLFTCQTAKKWILVIHSVYPAWTELVFFQYFLNRCKNSFLKFFSVKFDFPKIETFFRS